MDEVLIANFMIFQDAVDEGGYDLVIADEAWDIDHYWHEHPELKKAKLAWLTDFVGFVPMPDGGEREAFLTADYNAEMIGHIERHPGVRDRAIFVGNPQDIIARSFGKDLPEMRDWVPAALRFLRLYPGRASQRPSAAAPSCASSLGYRPDERVCIVTVGGSGVGTHLIRRILQSYPMVRARLPELRMILVAGPRIDPQVARRAGRRGGARLRARPRPPSRGLRPRAGAGRPDDLHGAHRRGHAVPLFSAEEPFRAELPRRPSPRSATAPDGAWSSRPRRRT